MEEYINDDYRNNKDLKIKKYIEIVLLMALAAFMLSKSRVFLIILIISIICRLCVQKIDGIPLYKYIIHLSIFYYKKARGMNYVKKEISLNKEDEEIEINSKNIEFYQNPWRTLPLLSMRKWEMNPFFNT